MHVNVWHDFVARNYVFTSRVNVSYNTVI